MLSRHVSDTRSRVTLWYIVFILLITTIPRVSNFYEINKGCSGFFDVILLVVTVMYILFQLVTSRTTEVIQCQSHRRMYHEMLLALYAIVGLDTLIVSRVRDSIMGWLGLFTGNGALSIALAVLVVLLIGRTLQDMSVLLPYMSFFLLIQDLIILLQLGGHNPFYLYGDSDFYGKGITTNLAGNYAGTLGNIGPLSNVLGLLAILLLVMSFHDKLDSILANLCRMTAALTFVVILMLGTSAVWLGYVVAFALAMVCIAGYKYKKLGQACSILFFVSMTCLVIVYFWDAPITLLHEMHQILHGNVSDNFGSSRIYIWRDFLSHCKDNFLFGKGLDSAGLDGLGYFVRIDDESQTVFRGVCVDGHSKWINILYGGGLITLVPFIAYFISLFIKLIKKYLQSGSVPTLACAVALIFWVTVWSFSVSYINIDCVFYCVLGMTHANFREEQYA